MTWVVYPSLDNVFGPAGSQVPSQFSSFSPRIGRSFALAPVRQLPMNGPDVCNLRDRSEKLAKGCLLAVKHHVKLCKCDRACTRLGIAPLQPWLQAEAAMKSLPGRR